MFPYLRKMSSILLFFDTKFVLCIIDVCLFIFWEDIEINVYPLLPFFPAIVRPVLKNKQKKELNVYIFISKNDRFSNKFAEVNDTQNWSQKEDSVAWNYSHWTVGYLLVSHHHRLPVVLRECTPKCIKFLKIMLWYHNTYKSVICRFRHFMKPKRNFWLFSYQIYIFSFSHLQKNDVQAKC